MERPDFLPLESTPSQEQIILTGLYLLKLEINLQKKLSSKELCAEIVGYEEPTIAQRKIANAVGRGLSQFVGPVKTNDNEKLIAIINMRQSELNLL